MTEEELRREAVNTVEWENTRMIDRPLFVHAYITGAKAHQTQWHDLRKNPNDFPPTEKGTVTIDVLTDSGRIAYYFYDEGCWYDTHCDEINPPKAWCEIPSFKE